MRPGLTTAYSAAIQASELRPALFVESSFISGPIYVWSGVGPLTWNGHTWSGLGSLGSISTIEETPTVEAKGITLTLSGVPSSALHEVLTEFQVGLPVIVRLGLFNVAGNLIDSPVASWAGRMDQPTIDVSAETATIAINCESKLFDMNVAVDRRLTNEDQQINHPGDRGLEFVPSIQAVTVYWGRVPNSHNNL